MHIRIRMYILCIVHTIAVARRINIVGCCLTLGLIVIPHTLVVRRSSPRPKALTTLSYESQQRTHTTTNLTHNHYFSSFTLSFSVSPLSFSFAHFRPQQISHTTFLSLTPFYFTPAPSLFLSCRCHSLKH